MIDQCIRIPSERINEKASVHKAVSRCIESALDMATKDERTADAAVANLKKQLVAAREQKQQAAKRKGTLNEEKREHDLKRPGAKAEKKRHFDLYPALAALLQDSQNLDEKDSDETPNKRRKIDRSSDCPWMLD